MTDILLLTPPFVQPNCPYPATAYLTGYLRQRGYSVEQADLSIETLSRIFSREGIANLFDNYDGEGDENCNRMWALRGDYIATIDTVMAFLRGDDPTVANLICSPEFLPQASRFEGAANVEDSFGLLGTKDCAEYLATLYLQDLSDFIRATVSPEFEIVKYAESISLSIGEFSAIEQELSKPRNFVENTMCELLHAHIERTAPRRVGISVPFPGNLLGTLRIGQYIKSNHPSIEVIIGGGYPTTELRTMTDKEIFRYVDYVVLDDGELALERILSGGELLHTYTAEGYTEGSGRISHRERGCPDFDGLPHSLYFSLTEVTNPMHRLWSDGRWNKMMLAHGCYWAKCAFCDTSLDYIGCYDASLTAAEIADQMERVAAQTGSRGFHFVDEAAPPKLLKELSLELLRRGDKFSWWTNIRFEKSYTGDLCALMARAGCVAVSGGLEVASDRLLEMIGKGITIEQATIAMRNFYYAGIMVHTYLMYGLPTESLQESIDAAEVVRQMFRAELIGSAFWHRYAMTVHSRSGLSPEEFGVRRKDRLPNPFANNEVPFAENRGYSLDMVGEGLNISLANWLVGNSLDRPVHKWFGSKVPATTVIPSLITDHLIKPDGCRIYNDKARLVWVGGTPELTDEGILIHTPSSAKEIKLGEEEAEFLYAVMEQTSNLEESYTFEDIRTLWEENFDKSFVEFYSSKKWDIARKFGLLQI
ncbi:MAG: cobalamin-dependent protein [Tidjanibacter sp.]|nr:cobalamin-dependent protein [Tidjanibacter sp.]